MPDEPLPPRRTTRIVATLGPASASREVIGRMVDAGVDVCRLNFSHADHETIAALVQHVRAVQETSGRALAILGDLQGPKLRIGILDEPIALREGEPLRITVGDEPGGAPLEAALDGPRTVTCEDKALPEEVGPGGRIFLRDGMLELEVTAVAAHAIDTVVRRGGELTSRAGINVPHRRLRWPRLTAQDLDDLRFAVEQGMDYVALSLVRSAEDLRRAREELRRLGGDPGVVAKIETPAALEHLDGIADESDALMVARGDLGVEVGPENVPPWQRRIVAAARRRRIPSIVATEMLESMRSSPRPTRAEANDVAHAAWEGADAVMLSAESAVGEYPVETVAMMDRILRRAEGVDTPGMSRDAAPDSGDAEQRIARGVREILGRDVSIGGVIAFSVTGYSARLIASEHPAQRVLALTPDPRVRQRLALVRGVDTVLCASVASEAEMLAVVDRVAGSTLGREDGETVVVVGAMPVGQGGPTNFVALRVVGGGQ